MQAVVAKAKTVFDIPLSRLPHRTQSFLRMASAIPLLREELMHDAAEALRRYGLHLNGDEAQSVCYVSTPSANFRHTTDHIYKRFYYTD